jgi:hypothetical protein
MEGRGGERGSEGSGLREIGDVRILYNVNMPWSHGQHVPGEDFGGSTVWKVRGSRVSAKMQVRFNLPSTEPLSFAES